jgi:branched-chain amino acid transport system permease protein
VLPLVAAIFGGYRTISGPLVGALVIYLVDQLVFKEILPHGHEMILGALLVAMIVLSPTGLVPLVMGTLKRGRHATA